MKQVDLSYSKPINITLKKKKKKESVKGTSSQRGRETERKKKDG